MHFGEIGGFTSAPILPRAPSRNAKHYLGASSRRAEGATSRARRHSRFDTCGGLEWSGGVLAVFTVIACPYGGGCRGESDDCEAVAFILP
jgi:hypothetical protein